VRGRRRVIVEHADGTRSLHGNEAIRPVGWGLQVRDIVESELRKGITDSRLSSGWAARKRPGQPDDDHPGGPEISVPPA
jgi:RecB family endonuclease NucS